MSLEDRFLIGELLDTYAYGIDTRDWTLVRTCFTSDAVMDFTSAGGIKGPVADVLAWVEQALTPFTVAQHLVTNKRVTVDGDDATSTCYLFNPMGSERKVAFMCGGFYRDRLRREDGTWRIAERVFEMAWMGGLK